MNLPKSNCKQIDNDPVQDCKVMYFVMALMRQRSLSSSRHALHMYVLLLLFSVLLPAQDSELGRTIEPNRFCIWVDGQKEWQALASLDQIVERTNSSVSKASRDEYISQLADRIRTSCGAPVGSTSG